MTLHPLLALAQDRDVRHSSHFRRAAADLSGEVLAAHWSDEVRAAPRRADSGKRFLQPHGGRPAAERQRSKDEEHLAASLVRWCRTSGKPLPLPEEGNVDFFDWGVPLKAAAADPSLGPADPNRGVERIDLIGTTGDGRLAVTFLKFLEPGAARAGTGDTPLRFLLEALAHGAIAEANRGALAAEVEGAHGRSWSEGPPALMLIASPRYWSLCRRREAQKGAAWIHEIERLIREVDEKLGVAVHCLALQLEGDPGWTYDEEGPRLTATPRLARAWEPGAGRVRPRPKARPKAAEPAELLIEADPGRPVRSYGPHENYHPGDRIEHPTLGLGVVQKCFPGKVEVRFGEATSRLVAGRPL